MSIKIFSKLGYVFLILLVTLLFLGVSRGNKVTQKFGVNLLYMGNGGMAIVAVRPDQALVSVMKLPDELLIPLTTTGAEYTVEGYRKVGVSERDSLILTRDSVARALGINLGAVIKTSQYGSSVEDLMASLWQINLETNLSFIDRYRLYQFLKPAVDKHGYLTINLPSVVMDNIEEIDGKKLLRLNAAVYAWVRNQWVHEQILNEPADILVLNASDIPGIARTIARQLEAAGGRVVEVVAAKKQFKNRCLLRIDKKVYPVVAEYLAMTYGCEESRDLKISDWVDAGVETDGVLIIGNGIKSN